LFLVQIIMMNLDLRRTETTVFREAGGCRIVGRGGLPLIFALLLSLPVLAFATTGYARGLHAGASRHSVDEKIRYCEDCHGLSAQGFHGYFPIPRLAGQQPQYLENQLRAFVERNRPNPIMSNVAHVLSPAMIKAIVARFQRFHPGPAGPGPKRLVAAGRQIFENGVPHDNVAACAACHGPNAVGHGEGIGQLAEGTRTKPGESRYLIDYEAGRAQLDEAPNRSSRSVR
jgi:cytochrome c553